MAVKSTRILGNKDVLVADLIVADHDPTVTATDAGKGSIIVDISTGNVYRKQDDGSTTNVEIWGGAGTTDEFVKISANDTTAGHLLSKVVAGSGITVTELNDGGDEDLQISSTADPVTEDTVTTTDANQTILSTITPTTDGVDWVVADILGRRTDVTGEWFSRRLYFAVRNQGGVTAFVEAFPGYSIEWSASDGADAWNCVPGIVGTNAEIRVSGEIGKTINWKCRYRTFGVT